MTIYTQASNQGQKNSRVNPQTGLINLTLNIFSTANRALQLGFNAMEPDLPSPYGNGFNLSGLSYIEESSTLTLSTGETYQITGTNTSSGEVEFLDKKLNTFYAVFNKEDRYYMIYYKDGSVEKLIEFEQNTFKQVFLMQSNGFFINYNYNFSLSGVSYLTEVTDHEGNVLLSLNYQDLYLDCILRYNAQGTLKQSFFYSNNQLSSISKMAFDDEVDTEFYTLIYGIKDENTVISEFRDSEGLIEYFTYGSSHLYNPGAELATIYIPRITTYQQDPGGNQPLVATTFEYPENEHNFLGYPNPANSNYEDNIYTWGNKDSYSYSVRSIQENNEDSSKNFVQERVFNTFHLPVYSINYQGSKKVTITNSYPCDLEENASKNYYEQPENLSIAIKQTTEIEDGIDTLELTEYRDTDSFGNTISQTDKKGITLEFDYYPLEGIEGSCPPEASGRFMKYIQSITQYDTEGAKHRSVALTYKKADILEGSSSYAPYIINKDTATLYDGLDAAILSLTMEYQISTDPYLHNLVSTLTTTHESGEEQKQIFGYMRDDKLLTTTQTTVAYDGLTVSQSKEEDLLSELVFKQIDINQIESKITYDARSRITSLTRAEGTIWGRNLFFNYGKDVTLRTTFKEVVFPNGKKTKANIDGLGRKISVEVINDWGVYYQTQESVYNELDQSVKEIQYDYIFSESDGTLLKSISDETNIKYDSWGISSEIIYSDGTILLQDNDLVNRQRISQMVRRDDDEDSTKITASLGKTIKKYNLFKSLELTQEYLEDGSLYRESSFVYDAMGRYKEIIFPNLEKITIINYDAFDRPLQATQIDGSIIDLTYETFTEDKILKEVMLTDADLSSSSILLQQSHDGLLRLTEETVDSSSKLYTYEDSNNSPSQVTNAKGESTNCNYIKELNNQINNIADDTQIYSDITYHKATSGNIGAVKSAENETTRYDYTYSTYGKLQTVKQHNKVSDTSVQSSIESTLLGSVLKVSDENRTTVYAYNNNHQLESTTEANYQIKNSYDLFGRVSVEAIYLWNDVSSAYDILKQQTSISYDEFSRETNRIILNEQGITIDQSLVYNIEDQIVQKITKYGAVETNSLIEQYTYDDRKRLQSYSIAEGSDYTYAPKNSHGNAFKAVSYKYDYQDNYTEIETTFLNDDIDTSSFIYDGQKLITINHTLVSGENSYPAIENLSYDLNGNLISYDDSVNNIEFDYNPLNQVIEVDGESYKYDAYGKVINTGEKERFYNNKTVRKEVSADDEANFIHHNGKVVIEEDKILGLDGHNSVIATSESE